jgi:hypothetical protein
VAKRSKGTKSPRARRTPGPRARGSAPGAGNLTLKRIERKIEPRVPDDLNLEELAKVYRLEGIATGIRVALGVPDGLLAQLGRRRLATQMPTRQALGLFRSGLHDVLRKATDVAEAHREQVEKMTGYVRPAAEEEAIADEFVRLIPLPTEQGGGWAAETADGRRGIGTTRSAALLDLAKEQAAHEAATAEAQ